MCRLTEESMRWLEMQGKYDKVANILKNIAKINNKQLPEFCTNTELEVMFLIFQRI